MANISVSARGNREVVQLVKDRTQYTLDNYSGYYTLLRKFHRYYLSASERRKRVEPDRDVESVEWQSDFFVPDTFATIETAVPRLQQALFRQRPYLRVVGRSPEDSQRAQARELVLDFDFDMAQVKYRSLLLLKGFLKYGIGIGRISYKYDSYEVPVTAIETQPIFDMDSDGNSVVVGARQVEVKSTKTVVRHDGPWLDPVSVFDFFPDPLYWDIPDMRYVVEFQRTTKARLEEENEQFRKRFDRDLYRNLDRVSSLRASYGDVFGLREEDAKTETADVFKYTYGRFRQRGGDLAEDEVWLLHYWENDRYIVIANGDVDIVDRDNLYDDKAKPYLAAVCYPIEHEFYGQGLLHPTYRLQEEENSWRNLLFDQAKLNVYQVWAADERVGLTDADMVLYPHKMVKVPFSANGRPLVTRLLENASIPPESLALAEKPKADWQTALAINDYLIGSGLGRAGTASEASMFSQAGQTRFMLQAEILETRFLIEVGRMFGARRDQFFDEDRIFRVLGENGYKYERLGPEDIRGEFDYMPFGSITGPGREVLRQQLLQLISIGGTHPALQSMLNWPEVIKEFLNMMDFRFPEQYLVKGARAPLTPGQQQRLIRLLGFAQREGEEELVDAVLELLQGTAGSASAKPSLRAGPQAPSPFPGNQEGNPFETIPTLPGLQAQVMGGPGGPVT